MRIKNRILYRRRSLFENRIRIGRKFDIHPFFFKFGKFAAIMDRRERFPQENCHQTYPDNGANHTQNNAQNVCRFGTIQFS